MAFNVYLTLFCKYNSSYLKSLEWRYLALCYGIPFTIAFVLLFPSPAGRGKIYGDAVLWCWIDQDWDFLRVGLCYGPAWCCILASMTIYVMAGREIFIKRGQLRAFRHHGIGGVVRTAAGDIRSTGKASPGASDHGSVPSDDAKTVIGDNDPALYSMNYKTTNVEITSTIVPLENVANVLLPGSDVMGNHNPRGAVGAGIRTQSSMSGKVYEQYSVNIGAQPMGSPRLGSAQLSPALVGGTEEQARVRKTRAALEANRAAWGYTKVALLFFISLLVTWVCLHSSCILVRPLFAFQSCLLLLAEMWQACGCNSSQSINLPTGLKSLTQQSTGPLLRQPRLRSHPPRRFQPSPCLRRRHRPLPNGLLELGHLHRDLARRVQRALLLDRALFPPPQGSRQGRQQQQRRSHGIRGPL